MKLEGSDLHLKVGCPPFVRVNGTLRPLNREPIDTEEMVRLIFPMLELQERRKRIFDEDGGVDFAHTLDWTTSAGGSASTCCSRWATSGWSPGA